MGLMLVFASIAGGPRGVPWGATSPLGAEGTVQLHCCGSSGSQGCGVALCSQTVTWRGLASCPSHVDPLAALGVEWDIATEPAGPFPLLSNSGWGWAGGPADGVLLHGALITHTPPPWVAGVAVTTGR